MARWQNPNKIEKPGQVGIPPRPFLYTLDQIAELTNLAVATIKRSYVHFDKRTVGARRKDLLLAHNIAPEGEPPEWRVAERELIRWLKYQGFRYYERGWFTH